MYVKPLQSKLEFEKRRRRNLRYLEKGKKTTNKRKINLPSAYRTTQRIESREQASKKLSKTLSANTMPKAD